MQNESRRLYHFLSHSTQRCVTVDTNGYAPLFFSYRKSLENQRVLATGVQIEPLAARTILFSADMRLLFFANSEPPKLPKI